MSFSEIGFQPSELEVDYNKNVTDLYRAITDQDWARAVDISKKSPEQAQTWVVRRYDGEEEELDEGQVLWRFLPLHSACARQPPVSVVAALLRAYPDGARCLDDQGMYPLHYACGNQASRDVVRILLVTYSNAAKKPDPRGMLPIHYLACWGPSSVNVVEMLMNANPDGLSVIDSEGNSPLDLAQVGEYPDKEMVVAALQKFVAGAARTNINGSETIKQKDISASNATRQSPTNAPKKSSMKSMEPPVMVTKVAQQKQLRGLVADDEEKKDDDSFLGTVPSAKPTISQEEYWKLLEEVVTLRKENKTLEAKLDEATRKNDAQKVSIMELEEAVSEAKTLKTREQEGSVEISKELEKAKSKLNGTMEELKGLRVTMVDMMEEHDYLKQRSNGMNDRLKSFSVSLEALTQQQKDLVKVLKSKSEERKASHEKRKETVRILMDITDLTEIEDEDLDAKLKKQTREIEALAAMVEAARD